MTFAQLWRRNLLYHWRGNLAIVLGVVLGTAVLTGALLVGDSLRGSLRELTERQLGGIEHVLATNRLFRQELAKELLEQRAAAQVCAALVLQGSVRSGDNRVGRVNIVGVESDFWKLWPGGQPPVGADFGGGQRHHDEDHEEHQETAQRHGVEPESHDDDAADAVEQHLQIIR